MAFGNQSGNAFGGFGTKGGSSNASPSQNNTGFGGANNTSFGKTSNGGKNGSGFGTNSKQTTGFGNGGRQNGGGFGASSQSSTSNSTTKTNNTPLPHVNKTSSRGKTKSAFYSCIKGKISQYKTYSDKTGNYRRLLPRKIFQALVYGQRFEDLLHSFIVTETKGTDNSGNPIQQKYVVNVHGSTNYGATLTDNEEVEVRGKFTHDNILMARDIRVINGSVSTPIKFQRSVKLIALSALVVTLFILAIIGFASMGSGNSISGFMNNVWSFITTMFAVYVILLVLYVVSSFTRIGFMTRLLSGGRRRSSPLITMLVIAFILTLLLYNVFGLGSVVASTLSGALSAVGPIVVMIIGIVILLKAFR